MLDFTLPRCLHLKNGGYYLVKHNRWMNLGRDRAEALRKYEELTASVPRFYYKTVYWRARKNARTRGIEFFLTEDDFVGIVSRAKGTCEVTGIPFTLANPTQSKRRPFAPSLDRIDSLMPYFAENCRLVAVAVNAAMSDWGYDTLATMLRISKLQKPILPAAL